MPGKPISFLSMTKRGRRREKKKRKLTKMKRSEEEGGNEVDEERLADFPRKYQVSRLEYRGARGSRKRGIKSP